MSKEFPQIEKGSEKIAISTMQDAICVLKSVGIELTAEQQKIVDGLVLLDLINEDAEKIFNFIR